MRYSTFLGALASATALLIGSSGPAAAQSLFASRGLGLVVEPLDARMLALGGVALGLPGNEVSFANPASGVGLAAPILQVGYRFDDFSAEYGGRNAEGTTARFPVIVGASPLGSRWAVLVGYGSYLDQNWAVEQPDTLVAGGDTLAVLDRVASSGGVARLRLGAGYRPFEGVGVGLGVDVYTGSVQRAAGRRFPGENVPQCCTALWNYGGVGYNAGVMWQASEALSLAAAATVGGTLEAEGQDSLAVSESYDLPATFMLGASGRVSGNTLVAASADWAGWSGLDGDLASVGGARDTWSAKGGVEYDGLEIRERPIPLRLGGRYAQLPFSWDTADPTSGWAEERAFTGGLGLVLAGGASRTDLAFERGTRGGEDAGIEESYWRFALSLTVLGR